MKAVLLLTVAAIGLPILAVSIGTAVFIARAQRRRLFARVDWLFGSGRPFARSQSTRIVDSRAMRVRCGAGCGREYDLEQDSLPVNRMVTFLCIPCARGIAAKRRECNG